MIIIPLGLTRILTGKRFAGETKKQFKRLKFIIIARRTIDALLVIQ